MAYKFQEGLANLDGAISSSGVLRLKTSMSSSGDVAVSGAMHVGTFIYGNGSKLTNISSDSVDVADSSANSEFRLVGVAASGDGVSLTTMDTAADRLTMNAQTGKLSAAGEISGAVGVKGGDLTARTATLTGLLSSSAKANIIGNVAMGAKLDVTGAISGAVGITGGDLTARTATLSGLLSSSAKMMIRGEAEFADHIEVTGAISGGSTLEVVGTLKGIGNWASSGSITAGSSFIIGSADLNEVDMEKLDGITNGTVAASKAVVVDANKDADGFRSVTASADVKAANVHATQFYGGGAGITGITSDAVDVTASAAADKKYPIVFTEAAQSNGSLGLAVANSANYLSFNQASGSAGAMLELSGNVGGYRTTQIQFAESGTMKYSYDSEMSDNIFEIKAEAAIDISSSHAGGLVLYGGQHDQAGVQAIGRQFGVLPDADGDVVFHVDGDNGKVSGSGELQIGGAAKMSLTLNVTGAISGAAGNFEALTGTSLALQSGGITAAGSIAGATTIDASGDLTVGSITGPSVFSVDASGDVIVDSIKTNGNEFVVSTAGLVTTTGITNAGAVLSSSHAAEIVGNSRFVGTLGVTGAITCDAGITAKGILTANAGQVNKPQVVVASTELTASSARMIQVVSGGTATITMILPSASAVAGYTYMIKRHSRMSGAVAITSSGGDAVGGDKIDNESGISLDSPGASVFLISDGSEWNIF